MEHVVTAFRRYLSPKKASFACHHKPALHGFDNPTPNPAWITNSTGGIQQRNMPEVPDHATSSTCDIRYVQRAMLCPSDHHRRIIRLNQSRDVWVLPVVAQLFGSLVRREDLPDTSAITADQETVRALDRKECPHTTRVPGIEGLVDENPERVGELPRH
jgi:hypothetical protein